MEGYFNLKKESLSNLFPFFLELNEDLVITACGNSIKKILGNLEGEVFNDVFDINRPHFSFYPSYESFVKNTNKLVVFQTKKSTFLHRFKGELFLEDSTSKLFLLASPWLVNTSELSAYNLDLNDFALHDALPDQIQLLSSMENINNDFKIINEQLRINQNDLIETNLRLEKLISNIGVGIIVSSTDQKIILANSIFCSLFSLNIDPSSLIGTEYFTNSEGSKSLFKNEDQFIDRVKEIINDKEAVYGDLLYLKDGRIFERDFIPLSEKNQYSGHIWKYQDITQVIHNKESLKRVDEKYRRIIENFDLGLLEVDLDEIITKAYPSFVKLTGYDEAELLGKKASIIFPDSGPEQIILNKQNELRKQGKSSVYEIQIQVKNGEKKWIIVSGAPIYDDNNEIVGSIGIHFDITSRKIMENNLNIAKEQALTYVKVKEAFITKISHEIRTPMNVILGMASLLKDSLTDSEESHFVDAIDTSANNLLSIINNILDFSDLNREEFALNEALFNLNLLIGHINTFFSQEIKRKNLTWEIILDQKIHPIVLGDRIKINQVLINLINNAIKFTNEGGVKFKITLLDKTEFYQQIRFEVIDTGIGISHSFRDKIFKDFSQESDAISSHFVGTGLGLAISNKIIANMGSTIHFDSEKLKGSNFYFDLTFKISSEEIKSQIHIDVQLPTNLSILVAEDNVLNQLLIKSILNKAKIKHHIVSNGKELIDRLLIEKYDVILLDIQMPIMDGIETITAIRNELKSKIPVIAISANAQEIDKQNYLDLGMNGVLSKPFIREELFVMIHDLIVLKKEKIEGELPIASNHIEYSLDSIINIHDGNHELFESLLKTLIENTSRLASDILNDSAIGNIDNISFNAHQLKSTLRIIAATDALKDVHEIEEMCESIIDNEKLIELSISLNAKICHIVNSIHLKYFESK
jgi:PAS domain S-box-containing protein